MSCPSGIELNVLPKWYWIECLARVWYWIECLALCGIVKVRVSGKWLCKT
ncbi:hypothetical protein Lalb_Chr13g0292711 [Lupinus albus]|uniref:Uncharacterized protein n=1 Tax=Lupinus albus TaxID=3870 RepID=A0A6A4PHL0_LUPAL|nr:hypothetical protein Lalb_Chr13g0292711 [Lupinus albus]